MISDVRFVNEATTSPFPLAPLTHPPLFLHAETNFSSGLPGHKTALLIALIRSESLSSVNGKDRNLARTSHVSGTFLSPTYAFHVRSESKITDAVTSPNPLEPSSTLQYWVALSFCQHFGSNRLLSGMISVDLGSGSMLMFSLFACCQRRSSFFRLSNGPLAFFSYGALIHKDCMLELSSICSDNNHKSVSILLLLWLQTPL